MWFLKNVSFDHQPTTFTFVFRLSEQTDLSPVWVSLTINYTVDMSLTL